MMKIVTIFKLKSNLDPALLGQIYQLKEGNTKGNLGAL